MDAFGIHPFLFLWGSISLAARGNLYDKTDFYEVLLIVPIGASSSQTLTDSLKVLTEE